MSVLQDNAEVERLLSLSKRPLYAFIRGLVRNREDADDVYQQTGLVLCEQFDRYDPSKPFIAWACGVAWRSVLVHRRNASRLRLLTDEEMGSVLADKFAALAAGVDLRLECLQKCLTLLKPESREIIERHYFKNEGIGRVADRMGVSESCVYKTLARIRRTLLDCVERKLKEDR